MLVATSHRTLNLCGHALICGDLRCLGRPCWGADRVGIGLLSYFLEYIATFVANYQPASDVLKQIPPFSVLRFH